MKIACVCGYYVEHFAMTMTEEQIKMHQILFNSAIKFFMKDCDVDYIFVTNTETKIDNVINLKIEEKVNCFHDMLIMKILCYKYLQDYDYVFILEGDEIIVNHITKDLLNYEFNLQEHLSKPKIFDILQSASKKIKINGDLNNDWKIGCFFGGKKEVFLELYKFTLVNYNLNFIKTEKIEQEKYTDEVFLNKFFNEKQYEINSLGFIDIHKKEDIQEKTAFLSGFYNTEEFVKITQSEMKYTKIIHDTKKDINFIEKHFKKYYEI